MTAICVGLLLFALYGGLIKKGSYKFSDPDSALNDHSEVDHFNKEVLKRARASNRPLIEEWINQLNASSSRPTITYWDFAIGSADEIRFTLLGESTVRLGHLSFRHDKSKPRVSSFSYKDTDGKTKSFKGYIINDYSMKELKANLKVDMSDKDKMSYINDVATTAIMQGAAIFDIRKYEKISRKEFAGLWNKKKINALCQLLTEEQVFASAISKGDSRILVTPIMLP